MTTDAFDIIFKESNVKKCAVIITKKVAKKAIDRNRAKRLIMEAFREQDLKGEFIFIVKRNIRDFKKQDINEIIEKVTKKVDA